MLLAALRYARETACQVLVVVGDGEPEVAQMHTELVDTVAHIVSQYYQGTLSRSMLIYVARNYNSYMMKFSIQYDTSKATSLSLLTQKMEVNQLTQCSIYTLSPLPSIVSASAEEIRATSSSKDTDTAGSFPHIPLAQTDLMGPARTRLTQHNAGV